MLWNNGMTMVFDYNGKQVRQLQGRASEKWARILKRADEATTFEAGVWRQYLRPMTAAEIQSPSRFAKEES